MQWGNYRYYCLDHAGQLRNIEWIDAEDDAQAIDHIQAMHPADTCEIWQGSRLVAKVSPTRLRA
jgi:hypothetical protein